MEIIVRFDMRAPAFGADSRDLYGTALEMARFADERGADTVMLTEHHGSEDGYLPAPFVLAGAIAAVTRRVRIRIGAVILPLHDPIEVAEQAVVLDQVSSGRAEVVAALGYVPGEYGMYGLPFARRGRLMDEKLPVLSSALRGENVVAGDRKARVTPAGVQHPRPPLLVAGGVAASARRAARYGDGFFPLRRDSQLRDIYAEECRRAGVEPGPIVDTSGPMIVHVGDDPDDAWEIAGPHLLHEVQAYGAWNDGDSAVDSPYRRLETIAAVRDSRMYGVLTDDDCRRVVASAERSGRALVLHPLIAGIDPEFAWKGFRRIFDVIGSRTG